MKFINEFTLDINDTYIWNYNNFLQFLMTWQGKPIHIAVPEGACLETLGVYRVLNLFYYRSVCICTNNIVESSNKYKIAIHADAFQYFIVPSLTDYSEYHTWTGNKRFGVFYNRPTWGRIGLASYLRNNYPDQTLLNFRFDPRNQDQRRAFELEKLFEVDPNSIGYFTNCYKDFPMQLEAIDGCTVGDTVINHTDQLREFYKDFLIDIVAETFVTGRSFYPTEKTVRPMLLKKPFILFGPKSFLIHLRQMGFRTFHDFWDEEYDGYDAEQRYAKILLLIDSLSVKSSSEMLDMYNNMQDILDHNYNLLLSGQINQKIVYIE